MQNLTTKEISHMIGQVFPPLPSDQSLAILVDFPTEVNQDNLPWKKRRELAYQWYEGLRKHISTIGLIGLEKIHFVAYENVGSNNADLPDFLYQSEDVPESDLSNLDNLPNLLRLPFSFKETGKKISLHDLLSNHQIFLCPTEYSTTAPLKVAARKYGFRAATMGGFSLDMLPALRLDFDEINRRVCLLKTKLDPAIKAKVQFSVEKKELYDVSFDLRFRKAHISGGRFPERGSVGNLPSGETYIVPYEGEQKESSETQGTLPVEHEGEVVLYKIVANRVVKVIGEGSIAKREREALHSEPAYGNIAELGFGVLRDFGLKPINEVLLDEKLGFHIAFGRSDHFGGQVGVKDFSSPDKVVHIDWVYIPETQPKVEVISVTLVFPEGEEEVLMERGKYYFEM